MASNAKKRKTEEIAEVENENNEKDNDDDKDKDCRLRHGLNPHCLVHIFQNLSSADLFTVGGMNDHYKEIINNYVISNHEVNCENLYERKIEISEMFKNYGKKIRKINYDKDFKQDHKVQDLIQSIIEYCEPDQLKCVEIDCDIRHMNLPDRFRNVEKFDLTGKDNTRLTVQLTESLQYLNLNDIELDSNFDWTQLKNLTELSLYDVMGINVENFIEFLHLQPKLRVFHHEKHTFEGSTQTVCETFANNCGDSIRDYGGSLMNNLYGSKRITVRMLYHFMSQLKNVTKVSLETQQKCGSDLIDALRYLAENDTLETLELTFTEAHDDSCTFRNREIIDWPRVKHFNHLKRVVIYGTWNNRKGFEGECQPLKLIKMYGPQIFSNVEHLKFEGSNDLTIIEFALKLRRLEIYDDCMKTTNKPNKIVAVLETLVRNRNDGQINGDFIEVIFNDQELYETFTPINSEAVKFSLTYLFISQPKNWLRKWINSCRQWQGLL